MTETIYKICNTCLKSKVLPDFHKSSTSKDHYRNKCKNCHYEYQKQYNSNRKDITDDYHRQYRLNNKEQNIEYKKQYYIDNKKYINVKSKKYYRDNKDHLKSTMKLWQQNNKDRVNAISNKRRSLKLQAIPKWFEVDLVNELYKKANYVNMQVDHIIPLNNKFVCGLHCIDNLQLLSAKENQEKSNKFDI